MELEELIFQMEELEPTPEQVSRLETLLRCDAEAQWLYLRHMHLTGDLRWDLAGDAEWTAVSQLRSARNENAIATSLTHAEKTVRPNTVPQRRRAWPWAFAGVAALALLTVLAGWPFRPSSTGISHPEVPAVKTTLAVGRVGHANLASWDGPALYAGDTATTGAFRLKSGLVRIDFYHGPSVTLQGPADIDIESANQLRLQRGRLIARVPQEAIGFRVDTAELRVVDLGTTFGIAADEQQAKVCVFEGDVFVAATSAGAPSSPKELLSAGRAVRVAAGSATVENIEFSGQEFADAWPVAWGVTEATGFVRFEAAEARTRPRDVHSDEHIYVFAEREGLTSETPVAVTITEPGTYEMPSGAKLSIAAGTRFRSYLIQFAPTGERPASHRLRGTIKFSQPVLGIIADARQLNETDAQFGAPDLRYRPPGSRRLDAKDFVIFSDDRHTVEVAWRAGSSRDQIRVLVADPKQPAQDGHVSQKSPER
jgi:hypothetical protein